VTATEHQPATPAEALRWAADRPQMAAWTGCAAELNRWADELDAAPRRYELPAEPEATELWDRDGVMWARNAADGLWRPADDPDDIGIPWAEALEYGPLSTNPPTTEEAQ
jgi:hypothetical protein